MSATETENAEMCKLALLAPYLEIFVEGKGCLASKALQWLADSVESAKNIRIYSANQMYRKSA
jgi:hypothetical protein